MLYNKYIHVYHVHLHPYHFLLIETPSFFSRVLVFTHIFSQEYLVFFLILIKFNI